MAPQVYLPSTGIPRDTSASAVVSSNGENPKSGGGVPVITLIPRQVVGLHALYPCTSTECRTIIENGCCYKDYVFGVAGDKNPTYENDFSSFMVDVSLWHGNAGNTTVSWYIEKATSQCPDVWTDLAYIHNSNYGTWYNLGTISNHPSYSGIQLNWGSVLSRHGAGCYRIKVTSAMNGITSCQVSRPFNLREFDCNFAHKTVKFEIKTDGQIGAYPGNGLMYNLCGMGWYDSIRVPGFFGFEEVQEYRQELQKYQSGQIVPVKDEAVLGFKFESHLFPKDNHDRLKIYGLMAKELYVSDYNKNNSDYTLKRRRIVRSGAYRPVYFDKDWVRLQRVTVDFKAGIQSLVSSNCCTTK